MIATLYHYKNQSFELALNIDLQFDIFSKI